jgi:putative protease
MSDKKLVGKVRHYFSNINVAVIDLTANLKVGDEISIEGSSTNVTQKVDSMQIEHKSVEEAKKGQSIGLKVADRVREGDVVFKL